MVGSKFDWVKINYITKNKVENKLFYLTNNKKNYPNINDVTLESLKESNDRSVNWSWWSEWRLNIKFRHIKNKVGTEPYLLSKGWLYSKDIDSDFEGWVLNPTTDLPQNDNVLYRRKRWLRIMTCSQCVQ